MCWLIISCASTPPAEEPLLQEGVVDQVLQENTSTDVATEEQGISEDDSLATEDNTLATEDLQSPVIDKTTGEIDSLSQTEDKQDYLQEIEIIDLLHSDETSSNENNPVTDEDDIAVVLDGESALVVETPNLTDEEIPPPEPVEIKEEDKALVVEEPSEATENVSVLEDTLSDESTENELEIEEDVIETSPETQDAATATVDEENLEEEQLINQENLEPVAVNSIQNVLEDTVTPSRSVVMDKNQYLDIRYPGTGWVYLGEVTEDGESVRNSHMTYFGRRRTSEDTSFTMRSSESGTTILHFFKQDVLSATFIDDFLEVQITDKEASNGFRVIAPSYEEIVPGYQEDIPQPEDFIPVEPPLSQTSVDPQEEVQSEISPSAIQQPPITSRTEPVSDPVVTQETPPTPQGIRPSVPSNQSTNVDSAPVIVPPRADVTSTGSQDYRPVETPSYQQELYEPEISSTTQAVPDDYNPQTGLSMEDMSLPWVNEELERQRTSNIMSPEGESQNTEEQVNIYAEQDELLSQAQNYFYEEDYPASLETLNKFFNIAVKDFDAAYYLKGQVLESRSSVKNIKEAQKAYKHVIDSYPQSPFWERAQNRYTYLSRFYFDIR